MTPDIHFILHVVLLSNADIYWDSSLKNIARIPKSVRNKVALSLLRWEVKYGNDVKSPITSNEHIIHLEPRIDQQDAWVIFPPLPHKILQMTALVSPAKSKTRNDHDKVGLAHGYTNYCELCFPLGILRSDNRLAHILSNGGLRPINLPMDIHAIHLQGSSKRTYTEAKSVRGDGEFVPISDFLTFDTMKN